VPDPEFPNRPTHDDFYALALAVQDNDAQADLGADVADIIGRYVDPESLLYMAFQRALRAVPAGSSRSAFIVGQSIWIDAFLAGVNFQKRKDELNG
jgi:hypothetical protein